jgi:hypothetical protein
MRPPTVEFELATLQTIATALAELDAPARARALQWLQQRFDLDIPSAPSEPTATASPAPEVAVSTLRIVPASLAASDEALSVETLGELFEGRTAEPNPDTQSVTGVLSEFVAEFQQIARDWDDACAPAADAEDADDPSSLLSAAS